MAQTLDLFRREFDEMKEAIATAYHQQQRYDKNWGDLMGHIDAGAQELGLRLHELALTGVTHTTIQPYLADPTVVRITNEMAAAREEARHVAGLVNGHVANYPALTDRAANLENAIVGEINTRDARFSSKTLRLNQSKNAMRPLLQDVQHYCATDEGYLELKNSIIVIAPNKPDQKYNAAIRRALAINPQDLHLALQRDTLKHRLALRALKSIQVKADAAYKAAQQACQRAQAAATAHNRAALAKAKSEARQALLKLKLIVDPLEEAIKEPYIATLIRQNDLPDAAEVTRRVRGLIAWRSDAARRVGVANRLQA